MSKIKIKYSNNVYYSDTDSLDLDIKLPDNYVSDELGKFKLENIFKKVTYLAPKSYTYVLFKGKKKKISVIKGMKDTSKIKYSDVEKLLYK